MDCEICKIFLFVHLNLHFGAIMLETTAVNADTDFVSVQFSRTSFAADRVSLKIEA